MPHRGCSDAVWEIFPKVLRSIKHKYRTVYAPTKYHQERHATTLAFRGSVGSDHAVRERRGGGFFGVGHSEKNEELWDEMISIEDIFFAWEKFRRGKRRRDDVMEFERHLEDNLFALHDNLASGVYHHHPYEVFTVFDPKQRTIHKACVRDRVLHQALVNAIEPRFERRFIHDSFSCRREKGTHAAVNRLRTFCRRASINNTKTIFTVKCDVRKFFDSIDHDILLELLFRRIFDSKIRTLLCHIIESFSTSSGKGIPLGNLTSQLFANVYLHELDWFVKQKLGVKYYVRYCDDFVMVASSRKEGFEFVKRCDTFLRSRLKLELHPNKIHVRTWNQGVDFLGYVILPHAMLLRKETAERAVRNISSKNESSYLGLCCHADAYEMECLLRNSKENAL